MAEASVLGTDCWGFESLRTYHMKYKEYFRVDDKIVSGFFEDYRFLSNFHVSPVYFEGLLYPSSENAYQAAKTTDLEIRRFHFINATPKQARLNGQQLVIRPDWETVKYSVMARVVMEKFGSNKELCDQLLATGDKELVETNHWNDRTWGVDYKTLDGTNWLGKILMHVRSTFRNVD